MLKVIEERASYDSLAEIKEEISLMNVGEWMVMEEIADLNAVGGARSLSLRIPLKQMLIILRSSHQESVVIKRLIQINGLKNLFTISPDGFTKRDLLTR